jgi:hypothetical protein
MDEYEISVPRDLVQQIELQDPILCTKLQLPKDINVLSDFKQEKAAAVMLDNKIALVGGLVYARYLDRSYEVSSLSNRTVTTFDPITHQRLLLAVLPEPRFNFATTVTP